MTDAQINLPVLKDRFVALWGRVCGSSPGDSLFERLVAAYSEPHRFYHAFDHIEHNLKELDRVREHAVHPDLIEMAIWFHDSVYALSEKGQDRPDNEEKSAKWAERELRDCRVARETVSSIVELILATRHDGVLADPDARIMADIDLSIFGQPPPAFNNYERKIRRERFPMPEEHYRAARIESMQRFLQRDTIYQTVWFQERYEARARENLTKLYKT